jgi:hypothetical protein
MERLSENEEYQKVLQDLEKAQEEGSEEEIKKLTEIKLAIEKEEKDNVKKQLNETQNAIVGHMNALYAQGVSAGVNEEAMAMYAYVRDIMSTIDPLSENFEILSNSASEFEAGLLDLIENAEALEEAMKEVAVNLNFFDTLQNVSDHIQFKEDRLEQQFARKQNEEDYSVLDTADYLSEKYLLVAEDVHNLQMEQKAWASAIGNMLSEENPYSQFVAGFDISTGAYVIDYNAANAYMNTLENDE